LNTEQISKDGDDQTGLAIFYCSENYTFCFMEFLRHVPEFVKLNYFEMNTIFVDVFLDLSSASKRFQPLPFNIKNRIIFQYKNLIARLNNIPARPFG